METLFEEKLKRNMDLIAQCDTVQDFLDALNLNDKVRAHLDGYVQNEYWDNLFHTFKHHGWQSRALALPRVTSVKELFVSAVLLDIQGRSRDRMYLGSTRSDVAPFDTIGGELYIKQRDGEFWCYGQGAGHKTVATYVTPTPELLEVLGDLNYSIECVDRSDNKTLIIANFVGYIGSTWLAIVDTDKAGEEVREMIPSDDMAPFNAHLAREAEVHSCVSDKTIDFAKAEKLGVPVVT